MIRLDNIHAFVRGHQLRFFEAAGMRPEIISQRLSHLEQDLHAAGEHQVVQHEEKAGHSAVGRALTPEHVLGHLDSLPVHPDHNPQSPQAQAVSNARAAAGRLQNVARVRDDAHGGFTGYVRKQRASEALRKRNGMA